MTVHKRRVFVTGIGCVSPIGSSHKEIVDNLEHGHCGIVAIGQEYHSELRSRVAGLVQNIPIEGVISQREQRHLDRFSLMAIVAGLQAWSDAGVDVRTVVRPDRVGVVVGVGMGGLSTYLAQYEILKRAGPGRVSPFVIPMVMTNAPGAHLSVRLGIQGLSFSVASACASSAHAVGESFIKIRDGYADVMLVGGSEAQVLDLTIGGFCAMKALSRNNENPQSASKPFDRERDGFVIGEGAGFLVLESEESVEKRGASHYAEILGYGVSSDAFHIARPAPEGKGQERAMASALEDACLTGADVEYVNAHGTGTPVGDEIELMAISRALHPRSVPLYVSSTKGATGHLLGAAGVCEFVFSVLSIRNGFLPPTLNLSHPVETVGLELIGPKPKPIGEPCCFLTNSFGFGGTNASLVARVVG